MWGDCSPGVLEDKMQCAVITVVQSCVSLSQQAGSSVGLSNSQSLPNCAESVSSVMFPPFAFTGHGGCLTLNQ